MSAEWELRLDRETFLAQYWQRRPLLIRNGISGFTPPLGSDELAGLALEEHVESRLIEQRGDSWHLHHGPFAAADFQRKGRWTLLVQAVDHYIPQVAALRRLVDFIPQWRVDDVMVSYAVPGGSAGPHYDNYDVFLLQGAGERRWKIGQYCDSASELLPCEGLRILKSFETHEEFLLRQGDILYVPPGVAHWGIAESECTTFSIGFRAPRITAMVSRWVDELLEQLEPDQFYSDGRRAPMTRPGEIHPRDLERATSQLQAALDQAADNRWFGQLVTEPKYGPPGDDDDLAEARALLRGGVQCVELCGSARLAWQQEAEGILVFANGEYRVFDESVLPCLLELCATWRLAERPLEHALADPGGMSLLDYLLECGVVYVQ
ncbi:MAG: cupin domain-containing protein [Halioglobus sp.]